MKVLLTGFEPFGGETINPAQEAVQLVKDEIKSAMCLLYSARRLRPSMRQ